MKMKFVFVYAALVCPNLYFCQAENTNGSPAGDKAVAAADDDGCKLDKCDINVISRITVGCKGEASSNVHPTSCLDYLRRDTSAKSGIYKLYDNSGNSFPAYCDLKSEPGNAWTLVMSWSNQNRAIPAFQMTPFKSNAPVNENAQNWNLYRLSLTRMKSLQAHSTHWRATCSYPTHGVDFTDYVRGSFKDFNIVDYIDTNKCKKVEYINIRGHIGIHLTVPFWQIVNGFLHTDSSYTTCQFKPKSGSVSSEDNFGRYKAINPKFRCTQGAHSTTQWWFGAHL